MNITWEVVIPTRGHADVAVAALIPHAHHTPMWVRLVTHGPPVAHRGVLETLVQLGCRVVVEYAPNLHIGEARAMALRSQADVVVSLDDDVVVTPPGALETLAQIAWRQRFAMPIARWTQNHYDDTMASPFDAAGEQVQAPEIWDRLEPDDPVVQAAGDLARIYDTGQGRYTDTMVGHCFAVRTELVEPYLAQLAKWPARTPGEDHWLGRQLGQGTVVADTFSYHHGWHTGTKWDYDVAKKLVTDDPQGFYAAITTRRTS